MKVIFLDIDGVLNTNDTFVNSDIETEKDILIDEFRVEYLRQIVEKNRCQDCFIFFDEVEF